jgi:diacylglycerol kinase (ATP)
MWNIIINPKSGKRTLQKQLDYLFQTLEEKGIGYKKFYTRFAAHATEIAKDIVEDGERNILVVGGDGTFSEVVNGIFLAENVDTSEVKIALLPHGTGNDWGRFWGLTRKHKNAIDVFLKGASRLIDVGEATYHTGKQEKKHYFVNSIGFGLDRKVVHEVHRLKFFVGSYGILYYLALIKIVFTYKSKLVKICIDDDSKGTHDKCDCREEKILTMNIGNGCYSGGGIRQNPTAIPYDGYFDAMYVIKPRFKDIITALPLAFNGKLTKHRIVRTIHSKNISVTSEGYYPFEADGIEVNAIGRIDVRVLPLSLQMVVPEEFA